MTGSVDLTMAGLAVVATTVAKITGLAMVAKSRKAKFEKVGTVSALYMYPVKSCGVVQPPEAMCTPVGVSHEGITDRHWMVLGEKDNILTMIEAPKLTQVRTSTLGNSIRLQVPGMPHLDLPKQPKLEGAKPFLFDKQEIPVIDCGPEAAKWISDFMGKKARIVFSCPELGTRDAYYRERDWSNTARQGDVTVFAYLTSYLVTSEASLRQINSEIDAPVSMVNFRPNIAIETDTPYDEDTWVEMRIGENVLFHRVEPCIRCLVTVTDPDTGARDQKRQPLEKLRTYRCREPFDKAPVFGSYMSLDAPGHVKVGDPVYVIRGDKYSNV